MGYFYTSTIWTHGAPEEEVYIVKDFTGLEYFEDLDHLQIVFEGNISEYNFSSISNLSNKYITLIYEPRKLSDIATGGYGARYKYLYYEEYEKGIIEYLNYFAQYLPDDQDLSVMVGSMMSNLPRMYDYSWMTHYLNKNVKVEFGQQDANTLYHVTDYEVVFDEELNDYKFTVDIMNPIRSVKKENGVFVEKDNHFGQAGAPMEQFYYNLSYYNNLDEIKIIENKQLVNNDYIFYDISRFKADILMSDLFDVFYEDGKPVQSLFNGNLPTGVMIFPFDLFYEVGGTQYNAFKILNLYFELPSYVDFVENDLGLDLTEYFEEEDLRQFLINDEKLSKPRMIKNVDDMVLEGWYTSENYEEDTLWNFSEDVLKTDAYVYGEDLNWGPTFTQNPEKLYAKFSPRSDFALVNYVTNNDQIIDDELVKKGSLLEEPMELTLLDHKFVGWYKDPDFNNLWTFSSDTVENDMTLYAQWEKIPEVDEKEPPEVEKPDLDTNKPPKIDEPKVIKEDPIKPDTGKEEVKIPENKDVKTSGANYEFIFINLIIVLSFLLVILRKVKKDYK